MGKQSRQKPNKQPRQKKIKGISKKKANKIKKNKQQQENNNNNDNEDTQNQQNGNSLQNSFGIIQKQKLLSLSSQKQLQTIKQLYQKILQKPQQNIKHLQAFFILCKIPNLKVVSVTLRTLSQIFINISPLQYIDIKKLQSRTQNKVTKDQFQVIRFQKILIQQYERFIKMLKQLKSKLKASDFNSDQEMFNQFRKCILQCALRCFQVLWNFNYARQLCDLLMGFVKFKQCRDCFEKLLKDKNIATVSIKVRIINGIAQLIKSKDDSQLPNDLIKILNSVYIDSRYLQKDKDALTFKQKKIKKKIYRQQAFQKKQQKEKLKQGDKLQIKRQKKKQKLQIKMKIKQQINKQFAQGQAIINNKQIIRNNSLILQQLFYVYFKILVQQIGSKFLRDALDGILTFAHQINIDLISSMIEHLNGAAKIFRQIWKKKPNTQNLQMRLVIVFTMESILNGPLSVYNMDDVTVTGNFYKILRDVNSMANNNNNNKNNNNSNNNNAKFVINKEIFRLICITLDQVFIKRRQLSQQIVGSFLREVSTFMLRKQLPKLYLLEFIRMTASKYSKISRMFEQDNQGFGLNSYNQICQDPQSTNAINTQILSKINSLQKYDKNSKVYQRDIHEYIARFNRQNFNRIQGTEPLGNILKSDIEVGF